MFGLMLGCVSMSADNRLSKSGYAGKIGLSVTPTGPGVDITTSHGYSFGNGLWIGGGAGVSCSDSNSLYCVITKCLPTLTANWDMRQTLINVILTSVLRWELISESFRYLLHMK